MAARLAQRLAQFNKEVHQFEDQHHQVIAHSLQKFMANLTTDAHLTQHYKDSAAVFVQQAQANLDGMKQAKSIGALEAYHQSFSKTLAKLQVPIEPLIWAQTHALMFSFNGPDNHNRNKDIHRQLNKLIQSTHDSELFSLAYQKQFNAHITGAMLLLDQLEKVKSETEFFNKRKQLLETLMTMFAAQQHVNERNRIVKQMLASGNEIHQARRTYLPETRSVVHKVFEGVDTGWLVTGAALVAVPVIVVAVVAAPAAVFALGIAGIGYGAVDLAKEIAEPASKYRLPKIGEREVKRPKLSRWEKAKKLAKKSAPIILSAVGIALAVLTFTVATHGAGLLVLGGLALGAVTVSAGMTYYKNRKLRKEHEKVLRKHKKLNDGYKKQLDDLRLKDEEQLADAKRAQVTEGVESKKKLLTQYSAAKTQGVNTAALMEMLLDRQAAEPILKNEAQALREPASQAQSQPETSASSQLSQKFQLLEHDIQEGLLEGEDISMFEAAQQPQPTTVEQYKPTQAQEEEDEGGESEGEQENSPRLIP